MEEFIYFDKSHKDFIKIKNLIMDQDSSITIQKSLDNLDYGYIHISSSIGYSFILCEKYIGLPFIKLICARPNLQDGEKLLKLVEEKSLKDGFNYIALHSIIENKLVNWYKKQGFKIENEITFENKKLKAYLMSKKLV